MPVETRATGRGAGRGLVNRSQSSATDPIKSSPETNQTLNPAKTRQSLTSEGTSSGFRNYDSDFWSSMGAGSDVKNSESTQNFSCIMAGTEKRVLNVNPDLVFTGKDYVTWKQRQRNNAYRDGFGNLLTETKEEIEWLALRDDEQFKKMPDYTLRQEKAKGSIYDYLDSKHFRRVSRIKSYRLIFAELDKDYLKTSPLDLISTRAAYVRHEYDGKSDFRTFLNVHLQNFYDCQEAGSEQSDFIRIVQLQAALPATYDPVYCDHARNQALGIHHSYDQHVKGLLDLHDRLAYANKRHPENKNDGQWQRRQKFTNTSNNNQNNEDVPDAMEPKRSTSRKPRNQGHPQKDFNKFCTHCAIKGHDNDGCFALARLRAHKSEDSSKNSGTEKKEETKKVANWSKLRNFDPKRKDDGKKGDKLTNTQALHANLDENSLKRLQEADCQNNYAAFRVKKDHPDIFAFCTTSSIDSDESPTDAMVLDSGTKYSMVSDANKLSSIQKMDTPYHIRGIHNSAILSCDTVGTLVGTVMNSQGKDTMVEMENVLYVPDITVDLLSVNRITIGGEYGVVFQKGDATIFEIENGNEIVVANERDGVMWVSLKPITNNLEIKALPAIDADNSQRNNSLAYLWHRKFAHINARYLSLLKNMVLGFPNLKFRQNEFSLCEICIDAKMNRSGRGGMPTRPERKFEIICSDILDVIPKSTDKRKLLITFIDAFSGYLRIVPIKRKSDAAAVWVEYHRHLLNKWPDCAVVKLRCDNAREYIEGDFKRYCEVNRIQIDSGNAYSLELNGLAERKNRSILQLTRSMLLDSGVETQFWPYAAGAAEYILNRIPTKTNFLENTPFEIIYGKKPDVSRLHPFGCIVRMHLPKEVRLNEATCKKSTGQAKLGPVTKLGVHFGYTDTGYYVFSLANGKISTSGDVYFHDELTLRDYNNREKLPEFANLDPLPSENDETATNDTQTINQSRNFQSPTDNDEPSIDDLDMLGVAENVVIDEFGVSLALIALNRNKFAPSPLSLSEFIPRYYHQAITGPFREDWIAAMNRELDSHEENETWIVVPRPENKNVIRTLWVYTVEYDEHGNECAKAHLVAFGCADMNVYNTSETYASVCHVEFIRIILSLSITHNLNLVAIDVTTAFLYGKINIDVFVSVPNGIDLDRWKYALKLRKSLYGLRISSKCWQNVLNDTLFKIGFCELSVRCVYSLQRNTDVAVLLSYVDDLLLACNSDILITEILAALDTSFKIKVNMSPKSFVGLELSFLDDGSLLVNQKRYIERLAQNFGLESGRTYSTQMETSLRITRSTMPNDDKSFRAMIGALLYIARFSRPDICFAFNKLSCEQGYVTNEILSYTRRIIRYIYITRNLSLSYSFHSGENPLWAFVDASHTPDASIWSISSFVLVLGGHVIDWGTKRQRTATKSSTEAEITAVCDFLDNIRIPCVLLKDLTGENTTAKLYEDNISALRTFDGGAEKNLRWALIRAKYVREAIDAGYIELVSIPSEHQLADLMTKALDRGRFETLRSWLLMVPVSDVT